MSESIIDYINNMQSSFLHFHKPACQMKQLGWHPFIIFPKVLTAIKLNMFV